jgi:deoxyadenosine/deoxycytidine kinase
LKEEFQFRIYIHSYDAIFSPLEESSRQAQWLKSIILANWETEMRRITFRGKTGEKNGWTRWYMPVITAIGGSTN